MIKFQYVIDSNVSIGKVYKFYKILDNIKQDMFQDIIKS
jgi:hypothetical protein